MYSGVKCLWSYYQPLENCTPLNIKLYGVQGIFYCPQTYYMACNHPLIIYC